jgi:hypothetical protein
LRPVDGQDGLGNVNADVDRDGRHCRIYLSEVDYGFDSAL